MSPKKGDDDDKQDGPNSQRHHYVPLSGHTLYRPSGGSSKDSSGTNGGYNAASGTMSTAWTGKYGHEDNFYWGDAVQFAPRPTLLPP